MFIEPKSDDYLYFDQMSHRYILTEKNLLDNYGINLQKAVRDNRNGVKAVLNMVSVSIYNFIHDHNVNNFKQDCIIACTESGRKIINDAMCMQFLYIKEAGYLRRSTDLQKRQLGIDQDAVSVLNRIIPEVGHSILYTGCI